MPKQLHFFVFVLFCECNVRDFGTCNTLLDMCFQDLFNCILQVPKFVRSQLEKPKNKLQLFSDCIVGWSKELQWGDNNGSFQIVFYECIEGKSGICLLLGMSIGDDWMINLMIIYIEKTIAKALDINDIINFFMGTVAQ
jgi:hypothetical protein